MNQPAGSRFNGPTQARQRIRLATAIGFLVVTGIGVGALASLARDRPEPRPAGSAAPLSPMLGSAPRGLTHSVRLEHEVREAEHASTRARAAIRSARQLGTVEPALLSEFEGRLGQLGDSPLDSVRRTYGSPTPPDHMDQRGRSNLRSIAPTPREL